MPLARLQVDYPPSDYESITVADTAIGLTAAKISKGALLTVETGPIRFRIDGTNPAIDEGHLLYSGQSLTLLDKSALENLMMIRSTAVSATVKVTHY